MSTHLTPIQKDIITGARRDFRQQLNRWGNYLVKGEWVTTDRIIGAYNPDNPSDYFIDSSKNGSAKFTRLENGHLKAELSLVSVADGNVHRMDFIVALDPYDRTFTGIGGIAAGAEKTTIGRASGSFYPKDGIMMWQDSGPGVGAIDGFTVIRNWGFVNVA